MTKQLRWCFSLPLVLTLASLNTAASGSSIRDEAGMFSPGAVRAATAQLEQFEKATKVPVIIETVNDLSLGAVASKADKHQAIRKLAIARDRESGKRGMFLLISEADHVISNVLIPEHLESGLPEMTREEIRDAFVHGVATHMKSDGHRSADLSDQDAGLKSLVSAIERSTEQVIRGSAATRHVNQMPANGHRPMDAGRPGVVRGGGSGIMTFVMIGLLILAVLFVVRMIGGLFGGRSGYPGGMGGGMAQRGMGPGPGYGGPGYGGGGGGGGGFMSGMMGGIGGALAGNWLYDQFSGRRGETHVDSSAYPTGAETGSYSQADEPIVGADDGGSGGADWGGDAGGGGGDWGGGDGGGDWGGGGGDGGGDW